MSNVEPMLTTAAAAKRVRRDRRTIERWIARGLPTTRVLDGSGRHPRHMIAEEDLIAWLHKAIGAPRQPRLFRLRQSQDPRDTRAGP